jgi:hypothetical protein
MHKRKIALKRAKRLMRNMILFYRNNRSYSYEAMMKALEKATSKDKYSFIGEADHPAGTVEYKVALFSLREAIYE